MSNEPRYYMPCLKWKQGEYQAIFKLSSNTKKKLIPLIEVPEIGYDFETRQLSKSIDDHLSPFARRVRGKWGTETCLVDTHLIDPSQRLENGVHPLVFVFDGLRSQGVAAIPITRMRQDSDYKRAIASIIATNQSGLGFRVTLEEVANRNFRSSVDALLQEYAIELDECDLILDLGAPNFIPLDGFAGLVYSVISGLPYLNKWRTFTLVSTSFPQTMGEVGRGASIIPRYEWLLYKSVAHSLKANGTRIPGFGDYTINHPAVLAIDMRVVKPNASIRYTIPDAFLIIKGLNVRDHKFGQYRGLCNQVIKSPHYKGQSYSEGDKYISGCASGVCSTGQLTTWRWVGTNHHMELLAEDIANLSF